MRAPMLPRALLCSLVLVACSPEPAPPPAGAALAALSAGPSRATVVGERLRLLTGRFASPGASAEASARAFLTAHAEALGLNPAHDALVLTSTRPGRAGEYLRFAQQRDGVPVFDGEVVVLVDAAHAQVLAVNLATRPRAAEAHPGADRGSAAAETAALAAVDAHPPFAFGPELARGLWAPDSGRAALAWRVRVSTDEPRAAWEVLVDAASLEVLAVRNRLRSASGSGMVFDPNPVVTTGDTSLRDNNDQTSPELDAARFSVTLPRLDGSGFTRGAYVDATTKNQSNRLSDATLTFNYDRSQSPAFEQVNAYFHLDRVQDRIQSQLGFANVNNRMQPAIVDAQNQDNSFYDSNGGKINYGTGGVDDAEDADILNHEYGHAVQDNQVPGFGGGDEGAMGEGFGDYLAASMQLTLGTQAGRPINADPVCIGDWDSTSYSPPCLRRVDGKKHWPEAADGEVHDDGEMWSAGLWGLHELFGADVSDTLVLEGQFLMGTSDTMQLASDAIVSADQNVYDGGHVVQIDRRLIAQGLSRHLSYFDGGSGYVTWPASIDNPRVNGNYVDNLDDTQSFTAPGAIGLRLHFSQIDTELNNQCLDRGCDNIYLTNGDGDLFQVLNGPQTQVSSAEIAGDTVNIRLVTDTGQVRFGYHVDAIDVLGPFDGGFVSPDGGAFDAGMTFDAGPPDAGLTDAGAPDAGAPDAGAPDGGSSTDAGSDGGNGSDAGLQSDGGADGGGPAMPSDSGTPDAGSSKTAKKGCGCGGTDVAGLWALGALALGLGRRGKHQKK